VSDVRTPRNGTGADGDVIRARILRGDDASRAVPLLAPGPSVEQRRRIVREELEGRLDAERIVGEARAEADALFARARERARDVAAEAAREAREVEETRLSAKWLVLRAAETERDARDLDRLVQLATVLAERIVGVALELEPARAAQLARTVLAEARGARRAVIEAHPLDAAALRQHLTTAGLDLQSVEVRDDTALARGELRLHTDLGTIDAHLAPRLERLAAALRDALG
jgi:flagellar biosynthesis/type III secretory pathway protein FliH